MEKLLLFFAIVLVINATHATYTYQKGYYKPNTGTYTQGHYKTKADDKKWNNKGYLEGKTSCY